MKIKGLKKEKIKPELRYNNRKCVLNIYFGPPGSGKTTMACYIARKILKKQAKTGFNVYSNVPITGTLKLNPKEDLGHYMVENGVVLIDECSIEYNNRNFKLMPKESIEFFKYHRHYETEIDCFSQSWDDIDVTLRRLAQNVYWVRRSLLPWFIRVVKIRKTFAILDGQIIDSYEKVPWSTKFIFTPPLHKMFNTLAREQYPSKEWTSY